MPNYGLVAESINNLADRLERGSARKRADELAMADIGLQKAGLDLRANQMQGEQNIRLGQAKRSQFLSEPVTIAQAIESHPKWNDQQKQMIINSIPQDVRDGFLNTVTTRGAINAAFDKMRENYATSEYRKKTLGFQQSKLDADSKYHQAMIGLQKEKLNQPPKPNIAGMKYTDKTNIQNLMGKYNITEGLDGGLKSPNLTAAQAQTLKAEAARMGLNVYLDQGEVTDTGSGWNPFDNKQVQVYKVRAIAPSGNAVSSDTGLSREPEPSDQGHQSEAAKVIAQYLKTPVNQNPMTRQPQPAQQPSGPQIVQRGQKFYIQTDQGEREATPEEINQWKQGSGVPDFINNMFTGTRPQPRRGGPQSVGLMPAGRGY